MENRLELERVKHFSTKPSRLQAFYCFDERASAEKALLWAKEDNHFKAEYFTELELLGDGTTDSRHDSNWITSCGWSDPDDKGHWMHRYWAGEPMPKGEPVWERLILRPAKVVDYNFRLRAYQRVINIFPDSVFTLELARNGAELGLDYGRIYLWLNSIPNNDTDLLAGYIVQEEKASHTIPRLLKHLDTRANAADPHAEKAIEHYLSGRSLKRLDMRCAFFQVPRMLIPWSQP